VPSRWPWGFYTCWMWCWRSGLPQQGCLQQGQAKLKNSNLPTLLKLACCDGDNKRARKMKPATSLSVYSAQAPYPLSSINYFLVLSRSYGSDLNNTCFLCAGVVLFSQSSLAFNLSFSLFKTRRQAWLSNSWTLRTRPTARGKARHGWFGGW